MILKYMISIKCDVEVDLRSRLEGQGQNAIKKTVSTLLLNVKIKLETRDNNGRDFIY